MESPQNAEHFRFRTYDLSQFAQIVGHSIEVSSD